MAATTKSIRTIEVLSLRERPYVVKTGETIFQGALMALDSSGELVDATATGSEGPYFVATGEEAIDNPATGTKFGTTTEGELTSAAAGTRIVARTGLFWFANADAIADSEVGAVAYCADNQSVKKASAGTSPVGVIRAVDSTDGVLVDMYPHDSAVPDGSITTAKIAAGAVDSAEIKAGAVDPSHLATTGYRSVASDGALAIVNTDHMIHLIGSAAGSKAATLTSAVAAQRLKLILAAAGGGDYTIACEYPEGTPGTLTLNAAGEAPELAYSGTVWVLMSLNGATFA